MKFDSYVGRKCANRLFQNIIREPAVINMAVMRNFKIVPYPRANYYVDLYRIFD
jgi:hypothetical protein